MKKLIMSVIIIVLLALPGCSGAEKRAAKPEASDNGQKKEEVQETDMEDEKNTATNTKEADTTTKSEEPTPVPEGLVLPLTTNSSGKVMIQTVSKSTTYPYNSYIITSVNGESVVLDPTSMPKKEVCNISPVAILSTHSHPDHVDANFTNSYECEKLMYQKGEINTKDFRIYTIQSSHNGDTIADNSNNVIAVIEVDGLRIAHMGDIGQTALTEDQLKELGEIDIAFMQFENSYSSMTLDNKKGFNMMEQLKPKLIIPTHYTDAALPLFEESYGVATEVENILEIASENIPDKTAMVKILNKHIYK